MIEQIIKYKEMGMAVIPVNYKDKIPNVAEWQKRKPEDCNVETEFSTPSNLGIVLGNNSGGLIDIDLDCDMAVALAPYFLPETGLIFGRKSKPKSHYIYKTEEEIKTKKFQHSIIGTIAEIRGNGAQTVFPPSVHKSGENIEFAVEENPTVVNLSDLETSVARLSGAVLLAENWLEHYRHDLTLALSGMLLKSDKWSLSSVENLIRAVCEAVNDEDIDDRIRAVNDTLSKLTHEFSIKGYSGVSEILGEDIARKLNEWLVGNDSNLTKRNSQIFQNTALELDKELTDTGNGQLFVEQHSSKARYVSDIGNWIAWDNKKWCMGDDDGIRRMAHNTATSLFNKISDGVQIGLASNDVYKWAKHSHSTARINAMITEAKPYLGIENNQLDQKAWYFNCQSGVINLKTGEILDHNPQYFITQFSDVPYNQDATCPKFESFLNQIFDGDKEVIEFVQRALGSSIVGLDSRRHLFITHGSGSNGKSTLLETIEGILGDYVATTPVSTLVQSGNGGSIPNDIARLRGVRMVLASEGEKQQKLSEAQIKRLTGGDTVTARFLNKEFFEYKPVCDFWYSTNHKPKISGNDPAIWNRVFLIPFDVTIPNSKKDPELKSKLLSEKEGILNWLVKGCKDWQEQGLNAPDRVKAATEAYQKESDSVAEYLNECVEKKLGEKTTKHALYSDYCRWCETNGFEKLVKRDFGKEILLKEYKDGKIGKIGHFWKDIVISWTMREQIFDDE